MNNQTVTVSNSPSRSRGSFLGFFFLVFLAWGLSSPVSAQDNDEPFILQPEDQIRINFPGAPELDRELMVRRDGYITMPIVGELKAAGRTPRLLEEALREKYENQLVSNEVIVSVIESHFTYYVEGEVRNPGIHVSFRQLSVLEAIIAAGGINKLTGKMKKVVVIRRKGNKYKHFELDLAAVIDGKNDSAFVLESYDIVSIPPRVW